MYEHFADAFLAAFLIYGSLGLAFGMVFVAWGVQRMDPEAQGASVGFRLIIIPGVVCFWPLLLRRWIAGGSEPPLERNPHR